MTLGQFKKIITNGTEQAEFFRFFTSSLLIVS